MYKKRIWSERILILSLMAGTILFAHFVSKNWFQLMIIHGNSMSPTYHNMQLVLVDKCNQDYESGDVIAFQCEGLGCILVIRIDKITEEGLYYTLGDNISESVDSRDVRVGAVKRENIIGKVVDFY